MTKVTVPAVRIMRDGRITIDKNVRDSYGIVEGSVWKITLEKIETEE